MYRPHFHFIGIGGTGMSAIAHILLEKGFKVSGTDLHTSEIIRGLEKRGVDIYTEHRPENINEAELVVYSSAIPPDNPELKEAYRRGLPVKHRAELLAKILNNSHGIAIAGAHGKTTTTSMLGFIFSKYGADPTVLIGALNDDLEGNARAGNSPYVIAEACESDYSFFKYFPLAAIVTNVEPDHLENYQGKFSLLIEAYKKFLGNVKKKGFCLLCADDPVLQDFLKDSFPCKILSYGSSETSDYRPREVKLQPEGSEFCIYYQHKILARVKLPVPGKHNVLNATAALAVGHQLGMDIKKLARSLENFHGARRRFQHIGTANRVTVIDDYAHHPTEVATTLETARLLNPERIVAFFQPKRYTRTKFLFNDFSRAFNQADVLIMSEILPFGEKPIPGITTEALAQSIEKETGRDVIVLPYKHEEIINKFMKMLRPGDLALTMGAGDDIASLAQKVYNELKR